MQSYGYKLAACLILLFICMQFILNSSFRPSRLLQPAAAADQPFGYVRRLDPHSFSLEDMDQSKGSAISRGYLSRSDYVYNAVAGAPADPANGATAATVNSGHSVLKECPAIPPALGEYQALRGVCTPAPFHADG